MSIIGQIKGNTWHFSEDIDKISLIDIWIFFFNILLEMSCITLYLANSRHFLVPVPGSRDLKVRLHCVLLLHDFWLWLDYSDCLLGDWDSRLIGNQNFARKKILTIREKNAIFFAMYIYRSSRCTDAESYSYHRRSVGPNSANLGWWCISDIPICICARVYLPRLYKRGRPSPINLTDRHHCSGQ